MADLSAALFAFGGVLVGGYLNNFLAEDFRRFRESQALAAAFAGELKSHEENQADLRQSFVNIVAAADQGAVIQFPEVPAQHSPIFDENAGKIGLLGEELSGELAYVYGHVRAVFHTVSVLSKPFAGLSDEKAAKMVSGLLSGAVASMDKAVKVGHPLVDKLIAHANSRYFDRPDARRMKRIGVGAILVLALLALALPYGSDNSPHCITTTTSNATSQTFCK